VGSIKHKISVLSSCTQKLGFIKGVKLLKDLYLGECKVKQFALPNYNQPISVRLGTSDVDVFLGIFILEHYSLSDLRSMPEIIVDAGAYVGYSSIYFANQYPHARIIAIEPEQTNFDLLTENTKAYPNIFPLKAALWCKSAPLDVVNPNSEKWAVQITESKLGKIQAITIIELMKRYNFDHIDILKLDIEGTEKLLFAKNYEGWLPKIKCTIAETHDRYISGCSQTMTNAFRKFGYKRTERKEHLIFYS
jgi:FkbM family methyltransferase